MTEQEQWEYDRRHELLDSLHQKSNLKEMCIMLLVLGLILAAAVFAAWYWNLNLN